MFCVIFRGFVNIMKILLIARQPLTLGFKVWGLGFGFTYSVAILRVYPNGPNSRQ